MTPASINADTHTDGVLLTTRDLAARWGMSAKSLANSRSTGTSPLPFVRIGRTVR